VHISEVRMEVSGLEGNRSPGGAPFQQNKHQIENIVPKMLLVLHNAQQFMRLHDFPGINVLFFEKIFHSTVYRKNFENREVCYKLKSPKNFRVVKHLTAKKAGTDACVSEGSMEEWR
jgi:hypothetical protein